MTHRLSQIANNECAADCPGLDFVRMNANVTSMERRSATRFQLKLPLTLRSGDRSLQAFTSDVSARGVLFYTESTWVGDPQLDFDITFPPEITLSTSLRVRCRGKVIRVMPPSAMGVGIAASIQNYEFLNTSEP
jgi:PilZ domain